jgi:hypothetical protein
MFIKVLVAFYCCLFWPLYAVVAAVEAAAREKVRAPFRLHFIILIVCSCTTATQRTSFYAELDQDDKAPLLTKTPQTDKRREELYKKYGHILNRKKDDVSPLNA